MFSFQEVLGNIRKEQSGVAASLAKAMQSSQFTGQKRDLESKVEKPAKKRRFRDESEDDDSDIDSEDSDSEEAKVSTLSLSHLNQCHILIQTCMACIGRIYLMDEF